jgi:hypothetical protein
MKSAISFYGRVGTRRQGRLGLNWCSWLHPASGTRHCSKQEERLRARIPWYYGMAICYFLLASGSPDFTLAFTSFVCAWFITLSSMTILWGTHMYSKPQLFLFFVYFSRCLKTKRTGRWLEAVILWSHLHLILYLTRRMFRSTYSVIPLFVSDLFSSLVCFIIPIIVFIININMIFIAIIVFMITIAIIVIIHNSYYSLLLLLLLLLLLFFGYFINRFLKIRSIGPWPALRIQSCLLHQTLYQTKNMFRSTSSETPLFVRFFGRQIFEGGRGEGGFVLCFWFILSIIYQKLP